MNRWFWGCIDWLNRQTALVRGLAFGLIWGLFMGILFAARTGQTRFLLWLGSGLIEGLAAYVVIRVNESSKPPS